MSNRGRDDDFDFDDDPFADDNDDPFGDDPFADDDADDLRTTARGSAGRGDDDFGGFDDDLGFEDDDLGGLDTDDEDFEFDEGDEEEEGGRSRRFVILAALIIILFIVALGAIVLFALNRPPSDQDLTVTARIEYNNTQIAFGNQTATQSILFQNATETAAALPTNTPTVTPISDFDLTATGVAEMETLQANLDTDGDGIPDAQDDDDDGDGIPDEADLNPLIFDDADGDGIGDGFATQTAEFVPTDDSPIAALTQAEQTRLALTPSATPGGVVSGGTLSITDVFATATALARTLTTGTPSGQVTTTPGVFPTRPPSTGQLPDTGLFDGMSGEQGLGMMALMAVGLVGVIFVSRRMRK